jgi:hypothetical protein
MNDNAKFGRTPLAFPLSLGQGELNRRQWIQLAGMLGLSSATVGGMFNPAQAAGAFDPKKYAGTKLSILMTGDENDHRALGDLLPQLEEETGIKLQITSPALGALIEKTLQNLKADRSSFELIEYLGFLATQQIGGGYFRAVEFLHRECGGDAARLGFPGLHPRRDEERRYL